MSQEVYMEHVNDISLKVAELIESRIKELDLELSEDRQDEVYEALTTALERAFDYPVYRNVN